MESVASVYIAQEFAHICFSLQWCSHTFLGEKPEYSSRGAPAQVPSSPPLEGLFRAHALGSCCQVVIGGRHGAGEHGGIGKALAAPGAGRLAGAALRGVAHGWAHGRSLWLRCALPLRLRILSSVSLALTVQSKLIYLQFAAGLKIEPC